MPRFARAAATVVAPVPPFAIGNAPDVFPRPKAFLAPTYQLAIGYG